MTPFKEWTNLDCNELNMKVIDQVDNYMIMIDPDQ